MESEATQKCIFNALNLLTHIIQKVGLLLRSIVSVIIVDLFNRTLISLSKKFYLYHNYML